MRALFLALFFPFILSAQIFQSQPQSAPMQPQQGPTQAPSGAPEVKKPKPFKAAPIHVAPNVQNPQTEGAETLGRTEIFTEPGITGMRGDKWVGSDNLFNLSNDLGLTVDIIAPEGKSIALDKGEIISALNQIFEKSTISTHTAFPNGKPAAPFLNALIMVYPVPQGYVAFVGFRLFEEAVLKRTDLGPSVYWQVITWERETLVVSGTDDIKNAIQKSLNEMALEFIERFKHFESMN